MKSFTKFITEAASNAAKQAKKLGLEGDGHGSWVDTNGRIVGRTVDGELVFNSGRKPAQETDPTRPGSAARGTVPEVSPPPAQGSAPEEVSSDEEQSEVEKTRGTLTLGFGRFNPPTTGHEKLINKVASVAGTSDYFIYPSFTQKPSKDPLPPITTPRVTTESDQSTVARLESLLAAHKTLQEQVNHLMAREGRTQGLLGGQSKGRRQQSGKTLLKSWMGANKVAVEPTVEPPVESGK